jgi:hypothetical protein
MCINKILMRCRYRGDVKELGVAERFLIRLGQVDKLDIRVEYFIFKLRLPEDLSAITEVNSYINSLYQLIYI